MYLLRISLIWSLPITSSVSSPKTPAPHRLDPLEALEDLCEGHKTGEGGLRFILTGSLDLFALLARDDLDALAGLWFSDKSIRFDPVNAGKSTRSHGDLLLSVSGSGGARLQDGGPHELPTYLTGLLGR